MIPVRCFTCNKEVASLWEEFRTEKDPKSFFQRKDVTRMCCKRMLVTHVPVIDDMIHYSNQNISLDENFTILLREATGKRSVSCD